jgi:hypothetical protein
MNDFIVVVIRGWGRRQRRIRMVIAARTKGAAIGIARQSAYLVGKARIQQVREMTA